MENFSKVITFETRKLYRTEVGSLFKVEGVLSLLSRKMYYSQEMEDHPIPGLSFQTEVVWWGRFGATEL